MEIKLKEVLRRELKNRNKTVNEASRETGISKSTLHNWYQGRSPTGRNLGMIKTLADYLHLSLSELLFNVKEENSSAAILFSSSFTDQDRRYRVLVEKLKKGEE